MSYSASERSCSRHGAPVALPTSRQVIIGRCLPLMEEIRIQEPKVSGSGEGGMGKSAYLFTAGLRRTRRSATTRPAQNRRQGRQRSRALPAPALPPAISTARSRY